MSEKMSPSKIKIMNCALKLFVEKGIKATTIRDIVTAVGVTDGAFYRHFESKEQLTHTLFMESYAQIGVEIERIAKTKEKIKDRIKSIVNFLCQSYDHNPELFQYFLMLHQAEAKNLSQMQKTPATIIIELMKEAQKKGECKYDDPTFCGAVIFGLIMQAVLFRGVGKIKHSMKQDADKLYQVIIDSLFI